MSTPTSVNPLTLTVALGDRSYPIHIGPGLVDDGERLASYLSGRQVMVVTNAIAYIRQLEKLRMPEDVEKKIRYVKVLRSHTYQLNSTMYSSKLTALSDW